MKLKRHFTLVTLVTLAFLFSSFSLSSPNAQAFQLYAIAGGKAEKVEGKNFEQGIAYRTRWTFYQNPGAEFDTSFFIHGDFPFGSLLFPEITAGWTMKLGRDLYFELGGGGFYSALWGVGPAITTGIGLRVAGRYYITLPVVYRLGISIIYMPHIGMEF